VRGLAIGDKARVEVSAVLHVALTASMYCHSFIWMSSGSKSNANQLQ
jgi:hypothetical protein